ncbi:MAG: succinate dehydrogenase, cytochrome b556 subunit [Alphaproteobacteria bacterium]|nr:MAG: succinate dehydrogenase, cytochrome b556 subunit [Alphaproteobacteria bacterium]
MADIRGEAERPVSPHLQIYKPTLTMVMSIMHRITGAALYFGSLLLTWWLVAAASGEAYFTYVSDLFGSIAGRLVLFGYTWALIHHMLGGIRHLIWDTGRGFDLTSIDLLARATVIGSLGLTLLIWVLGYMAMGAL